LARRIFLRLVKAKKVEGAGTLVLTEDWGKANPDIVPGTCARR